MIRQCQLLRASVNCLLDKSGGGNNARGSSTPDAHRELKTCGLHSASRRIHEHDQRQTKLGTERKRERVTRTISTIPTVSCELPRNVKRTETVRNGTRNRERRGKKKILKKPRKRPAAVCVTVPHRALTAPRRVASLKSRLTPTCSTGGDADWSTPPATPAIGTPIKLSENFPRYIVRTSPTPTSVPDRGPTTWGGKWDSLVTLEEGRHFRTADASLGVSA